jgi:diguanylate cyclase (GGDEF)-like protein
VVTPETAGLMSGGHQHSTIILICGLLLTAALTSFLWKTYRYARDIEIANVKSAHQNLRFDAALNNMAHGLLMYDAAGKLIISNLSFVELFGLPLEKWKVSSLGATVTQTIQLFYELTNTPQERKAQFTADFQNIFASRYTGSFVFERGNGQIFSASCSPMTDGGFVVTFDDITERRRAEKQIAHMAHHDALTELPNRVLFYERMDALLADTRHFAVLSMDLDRFKSINDTLGHPIGDKLLKAVAERMRDCVRDTDIIARLGGDEFAIVQEPLRNATDTISLAKRLVKVVSAPYRIDGHQISVGTSVGIAIAPDDGSDPEQLMKKADLALYRCKAKGGSVYRFFEAEMEARIPQRGAIEPAL